MVPFTCLSAEVHLAKVCAERPGLAIQIRDLNNEAVCPENYLALEFCNTPRAAPSPSHTHTHAQLKPYLHHQETVLHSPFSCLSVDPTHFFQIECVTNWAQQPVPLTCWPKQLTAADKQTMLLIMASALLRYPPPCNYFSAWEHPQMGTPAEEGGDRWARVCGLMTKAGLAQGKLYKGHGKPWCG